MNDVRLLIVEEDPIQQFALTELAQNFDYESDTVASIEEALSFISLTKYAAVLINTELPTVNGFDCARRIRDSEKLRCERVPIIGLRTGKITDAKQICLEAGMDDLLSNPYSGEELRQVLLRWAYQSCQPNLKLLRNPSMFGHSATYFQ